MMALYVILLIVGVSFTLLSFIFSGAFEASVDAGVDVGADVGADVGGDFGHDISGGDVGIGEVHFPLFSPVVIASFVTAFGGGGIIGLELFPILPILSLPIALGSGILVGLATGFIVKALYKHVQANALTYARGIVGKVAEVTEAISASSVGQIAFSGEGSRLSGPARSEEKKDIKRHAIVTITRVVGGLYYVREHIDEKLRDVPEEPPAVEQAARQKSNQPVEPTEPGEPSE